MSGYAGNLTYPTKPLLFNSVSAQDFGVFTNSVTSQKELLFKKSGISLPYKNKAGTIVGSVKKILPKAWTPRVVLALLGSNAPAEDLHYEYGFTINREVKNPGVGNSEITPFDVYYGGSLPKVTTTSGIIDAVHMTTMREDIIDQITNHKRYSSNGYDAWVNASLAKIITWDAAKTLDINGVTAVVGATVAAFITGINADPTTLVTAYALPAAIGTSKVVLIAAPGTKTMTLEATAAGTIMVVDTNDYIGLVGKETDINFHFVDPTGQNSAITIVEGNFALMSADDVYREFSQMVHDGALANQHRVEKPLNAPYVKYVFEVDMPSAGFHGASEGHSYKQEVVVYVLQSLVATDKWDASGFMWESVTDDAGFVADTNLDELFGVGGATGWKS